MVVVMMMVLVAVKDAPEFCYIRLGAVIPSSFRPFLSVLT